MILDVAGENDFDKVKLQGDCEKFRANLMIWLDYYSAIKG
jgi:hypothetical protein